jgi:hypothetical protein
MSTFRKIAREAVIFMLLGPVVVAIVAFAVSMKGSTANAKSAAAKAVYAYEALPPPPGFIPDDPVIQVPLTNGTLLFVTDCNRKHPWIVTTESPTGTVTKTSRCPPGASNGVDCFYFSEGPWVEHGGQPDPERLGSPAQVAIEEQYWLAYRKAKNQNRAAAAIEAAFLSLWGFPAGIVVWIFYRLVRFAVKG